MFHISRKVHLTKSLPYEYLEKHLHNLILRRLLFVRHSLDVGIHCELESGVTQEFLDDSGPRD